LDIFKAMRPSPYSLLMSLLLGKSSYFLKVFKDFRDLTFVSASPDRLSGSLSGETICALGKTIEKATNIMEINIED